MHLCLCKFVKSSCYETLWDPHNMIMQYTPVKKQFMNVIQNLKKLGLNTNLKKNIIKLNVRARWRFSWPKRHNALYKLKIPKIKNSPSRAASVTKTVPYRVHACVVIASTTAALKRQRLFKTAQDRRSKFAGAKRSTPKRDARSSNVLHNGARFGLDREQLFAEANARNYEHDLVCTVENYAAVDTLGHRCVSLP